MRRDRADAPLKRAPLVRAAADPRSFPWKTRIIHSEWCREVENKPNISLMTRAVSVSAYDRCVFTQSPPPGLRVIAPPMSPCSGSLGVAMVEGGRGSCSTSHLRPMQAPWRVFMQNNAAFQLSRWENTEVDIYRKNDRFYVPGRICVKNLSMEQVAFHEFVALILSNSYFLGKTYIILRIFLSESAVKQFKRQITQHSMCIYILRNIHC